jgi:mRNA interferase RelE/StbE
MGSTVIVSEKAAKEVARLPRSVAQRVVQLIEGLEQDARPGGCLKLKGEQDLWRIRIGDYRVLYSIDDESKSVVVLGVKHRSDAYR